MFLKAQTLCLSLSKPQLSSSLRQLSFSISSLKQRRNPNFIPLLSAHQPHQVTRLCCCARSLTTTSQLLRCSQPELLASQRVDDDEEWIAIHQRVSYNGDPIQDHVPEFIDITESSGDNGDGNDVEVDVESHVKVKKVKKQASKMATNKEKGNQRRPSPPPTNLGGPQSGK
ncbi:hypothetical protein Cgig2_025074 [Carnegiea gigantea]|uniref:Uncharacterized protein n=1 Tax=Carnegiea gigantea TaxID=171969 RepID=A0A9Q1JQV7_9CARY|nr:hypothetical protein Cgig2_025074 [Carnegiea gigantea]